MTGGSSGIGLETVRGLCKAGASVVIACKNRTAAEEAVECMKKEINAAKVEFMFLNLASFQSIRAFAKRFLDRNWPLHILVNNAGIMLAPYSESADGYEVHFAVNYLGHFLLTHLLLDKLKSSGSSEKCSRIVNISSCVHEIGQIQLDDLNGRFSMTPDQRYSQSKLAQILFTYQLQHILTANNDHVTTNALHPGIVSGALYKYAPLWCRATIGFPVLKGLTFKAPEQGAFTVLYACLAPELEGVGGQYLDNCMAVHSSALSYDVDLQKRLWEETMKLVKLND